MLQNRRCARPSRALSAAALLLLVAGCQVKLVSDYDENFVKAALDVARDVSALLQSQRNLLSEKDGSYATNLSAYNRIEVDLNTLLVLTNAHENNDPSVAQVHKLIETVHGLERLHQAGPLSPAYLAQKQDDIDREISILIRTENAKKAVR